MFLLIFQNVVIYKMTELFEVYALRRVGEIEPMLSALPLARVILSISNICITLPGACVIKLIFPYYGHMTVIRKNHHGQNISVFKALFLCSL